MSLCDNVQRQVIRMQTIVPQIIVVGETPGSGVARKKYILRNIIARFSYLYTLEDLNPHAFRRAIYIIQEKRCR